MPDLDLVTTGGSVRVYSLLHDARPVLIDFERLGNGSPADRVVEAEPVAAWELPVVGAVPAPSAVLVRPDGYVAWVGEDTRAGLGDAIATWFGSAG